MKAQLSKNTMKAKVTFIATALLAVTLLVPTAALSRCNTIKIASFNIQIFGVSKASKPDVMNILADTISKFDLVAIQEIRDKTGTAINDLEAAVDSLGTDYDYIIGPRLGRSTSKEQYAYIYNTSTITAKSSYTYDDTAMDLFSRDPYIAAFKAAAGTFDFVLISIHTAPDDATQEINALNDVVKDAQSYFKDEKDFIVLGDFNADCSYFDEDDTTCPLRAECYKWIITNEMDTNLAKSSCTYDRIVITKAATAEDYADKCGVYRFDQIYDLKFKAAKRVSDHYPVYAVFYIDHDSDTTVSGK